jgi:CO dehydrogenase nickel-insertion accessory protein CooC1
MKSEQIQTLHPQIGKTNKRISLEKYLVIKKNIISILNKTSLSHTELMEQLYERLKNTFEGGIQWHGEIVKLDLEARLLIERTKSKPEKYRLLP